MLEFLVTDASLVWKFPQSMSFQNAAAIGGIGVETAAFALFNKDGLGLSHTPFNKCDRSIDILIWAGSSSVGQYAIQLAHAAGYRIVTTCSPKNFELVKRLGAYEVYDYKDYSTPQVIKQRYPNLQKALDCVSIESSARAIHSSLSSGLITYLLPPPIPSSNPHLDQKWFLIYTTRGREINYNSTSFKVNQDHRGFAEDWLRRMNQVVTEGIGFLEPNRIKNFGGLDKVVRGFTLMKENKISAEKIVFTIAQ